VSKVVALPFGLSQLSFRHRYELENGFDGGVLEIKIGSGAFADILSAGGSFVSGGYNSTLSTHYSNPLGGRQAWSGTNTAAFSTVVVNLPAAAAGQNVQFQWRCGTDTSVGAGGWWVDSVAVIGAGCCAGGPIPPTGPTLSAPSYDNGQFQLRLDGTPGSNYVVQASTNLAETNWVSLRTNPAPFLFIESNAVNFPQRFYRGRTAP
jgi:hypothetical protein